MRRGLVLIVMLRVAASCGDDAPAAKPQAPANVPTVDASAMVDAGEAEPPLGNFCGDRAGLEPISTWPLPGGCATRAGLAPFAGPSTPTLAWRVPVSAPETSPSLRGTTTVWVGTPSGDILAIAGGEVIARFSTGAPVRSSAAIDAQGTAIIGGGDGVLYGLRIGPREDAGADGALDAGDAAVTAPRVVFSVPVGPMRSSPVIAGDGTIYVAVTTGDLVAIAPPRTEVTFRRAIGDTRGSSPAIGQDGTVYVGSSNRKLYAFAPNGAERWTIDLGSEVGSPAIGGDGTLYVGTLDGKLHALTPAGTLRWSYATGGAITTTPAINAGTVYVGSEDKRLHAVSVTTGTQRWAYATQGAVGTPIVTSTGLYVGAADGRVYALTTTGELRFAVGVRGRVTTAPAIAPGPFLFVTSDTSVVAIGP
jgi:outer membrane protein assembly factor BamB